MSKIEDYKLQEIVIDMRSDGRSLRAIANFLNTKIPLEDEPISEMAVSRWLKSNKDLIKKKLPSARNTNYLPMTEPELNDNGVEQSEDINPYEETLKLINDCDLQIELLKRQIEPARRNKISLNDRGNLEKLHTFIARKQMLLDDVAKYQKEMASFAQVREMLKMVYETMNEVCPEAYEMFKKRIAEKQALKNMLKTQ